MFCPNCGTQNEDRATACQKCGFNLKGAAAPKFKGTMLMVNAPPMVPRPSAPAAPATPTAGSPSPTTPGAKPAAPAGKPLMKATMIGVAPPSPGAVAPPAGPAPVPFAPTPVPAIASATTAMAAPVAAPHAQTPAAVQAPVAPPASVNPLGGTMVATPGGMGYGSPAPAPAQYGQPAGYGAPAPAPAPGFAPAPVPMGPAATPDFNALSATTPSAGFAPADLLQQPPTPQANAGWGQPPAASPAGGFGAPATPAAGGYGAPPAYGAPLAYGAPPAYGAMSPVGQPGYPVPGPTAPHGPIGKTRNPVMVVVLTYVTCGLYGILSLFSMLGELKAFRQKDDINPILFLLPIISLLELIKLPAKVLEAKRMAGVPNAQEPNVILYLFLGLYFIPADLNEVWQAASARQGMGALPPAGM